MKTELRHFARRNARPALLLSVVAATALALTTSAAWAWFSATVEIPGNVVTTGAWVQPFKLCPGTSKARHWEIKDIQPARVLPIAQLTADGDLYLDFGDEVRNNSNASPDVFRIVSLTSEPRDVTFEVSGSMAAFVTDVHLCDPTPGILEGDATESVYIKIHLPNDAELTTYTGTLTVIVEGWETEIEIPMMIRVRAKHLKPEPPPVTVATPTPTASATAPAPSPTASVSTSPTASATPTCSATPTTIQTPLE